MLAHSGQNLLKSVCLPILAADIEQNLPGLLRLWSDSRFFPVLREPTVTRDLLVIVNNANEEQLQRVRDIFSEFPDLRKSFHAFHAFSAGLEGDRDLYARAQADAVGQFGNKAGPNFLFQETMRAAHRFGGFTLQAELDCLPIQAGWLDDLEQIVQANARAWVIGTIFSGDRGMEKPIQMHLNGNAVYKAGDPDFIDFLDNQWIAGLLAQAKTNPNLAYDCWWALEIQCANPYAGNPSWQRVRKYDCFFRNDPFLINILGGGPSVANAKAAFKMWRDMDRTPVFIHGGIMLKATRHLLDNPQSDIFGALDALVEEAKAVKVDFYGKRVWRAREFVWAGGTKADGATSPKQILLQLAGMALLNPIQFLQMQNSQDLRGKIEQLLQEQDVDESLRSHFDQISEWAKQKTGELLPN